MTQAVPKSCLAPHPELPERSPRAFEAQGMTCFDHGIPGLLEIHPRVFGDPRGFFLETYQKEKYQALGLPFDFLQDNASMSQRGIFRGLHFQWPTAQGKLVQVLRGRALDVVLDIRRGSPSFGEIRYFDLTADAKVQVYLPRGVAHGFVALEDDTLFTYKCDALYAPQEEASVHLSEARVESHPLVQGLFETLDELKLSEKDRSGVPVQDLPEERQPRFSPGTES